MISYCNLKRDTFIFLQINYSYTVFSFFYRFFTYTVQKIEFYWLSLLKIFHIFSVKLQENVPDKHRNHVIYRKKTVRLLYISVAPAEFILIAYF